MNWEIKYKEEDFDDTAGCVIPESFIITNGKRCFNARSEQDAKWLRDTLELVETVNKANS